MQINPNPCSQNFEVGEFVVPRYEPPEHRYWVGGTGNWDDATNHWASESGGTPDAGNLPTETDNIIVDGNSGFGAGGSITGSGTSECHNFVSLTGQSYTLAGSLKIYGSARFEQGITVTAHLYFHSTIQEVIDSKGVVLADIDFMATGGTWKMRDDFESGGLIILQGSGTLDSNNKTVTVNTIQMERYSTIRMRASLWQVKNSWFNEWGTIECGTSTLKFLDEDQNQAFYGGYNPQTYHKVWFSGTANHKAAVVYGSNTINEFRVDAGRTLNHAFSYTQTFTTLICIGTSTEKITLQGIYPDTEWTWHCDSGEIICDFLILKRSTVEGGAIFYAGDGSTDGGNNHNWIFSSPKRYWIGGSGAWSNTAHWSTASGGSGGASLPTSAHNVAIDENSGSMNGWTIGINESANCKNLSFSSGASNLVVSGNSQINILGSLTLESGLTLNVNVNLNSTGTENLTQNGATISANVLCIGGAGSAWTLQENLILTNTLRINVSSTFDANNYNVTAGAVEFLAGDGETIGITLGSGTWELKSGGWNISESGSGTVNVTAGTSTIKFTGTAQHFYGAGKTYNDIWFANSGETEINGSNTFSDLKANPGTRLAFEDGSTQTVTTFDVIGTQGHLIYLYSHNHTTEFSLSCASGIIQCDYLDIDHSIATGGASWRAGEHSVDHGTNQGWLFGSLGTLYWVNGAGNWSDTDHWSYSSGGQGGDAPVPDQTTNVVIDENSGFDAGGILLVDTGTQAVCKNLTSQTGHTYEIQNSVGEIFHIYGSIVLESTLTLGNTLNFYLYSTEEETIESNGCEIPALIILGGGIFTLQDNLNIPTGDWIEVDNGTLDANDFNITSPEIYCYGESGNSSTFIMGSGTWSIGYYWEVYENAGTATIVKETSTIKFVNSIPSYFTGGGKVYNNIWFAGSDSVTINDSNTFNDFKLEPGGFLIFDASPTTTVTTFTAIGTALDIISLTTTELQWTISCASGTINCDYLELDHSTAEGGATFHAGANSSDLGNNTGWLWP